MPRLRARPVRVAAFSAFTAAILFLVLWPLFQLQRMALENGAGAYREVFSTRDMWDTLQNTLVLAVGSLALAMVLGTGLAWSATRLPRRLGFMRMLPILPIVVPSISVVVGWSFLLSPRPGHLNQLLRQLPWWSELKEGPLNVYSMLWIVIITGLGLTSFIYLFVSTGIRNLGSEVVEAAHASGAGRTRTFVTVVLPLLRPSLMYGAGVGLLLALGQFAAPLLLGTNVGAEVLATEMYEQTTQVPAQYARAAAIGSPLLLFGIAMVILQRIGLSNQARFVTHGGKGAFKSGAKPTVGSVLAIGTFFVVSTVLPTLALLNVALSRFWSGKISPTLWTLDNFRVIFDRADTVSAIRNSVTLSVVAVAVSLPIGYVIANLLVRGKGRFDRTFRWILDLTTALPLGIPAVIFGVGFLLAYSRPPFVLYGTTTVILLVYVTLMLPFTVRMQTSALIALGEGYVEAARASGASALKTHLTVLLPLMRPALGGLSALMFILLASEFSASLLVRAPTTNVMGTLSFDYYSTGNYPLVAALALIMSAVTSLGVALAVKFGGSDVMSRL